MHWVSLTNWLVDYQFDPQHLHMNQQAQTQTGIRSHWERGFEARNTKTSLSLVDNEALHHPLPSYDRHLPAGTGPPQKQFSLHAHAHTNQSGPEPGHIHTVNKCHLMRPEIPLLKQGAVCVCVCVCACIKPSGTPMISWVWMTSLHASQKNYRGRPALPHMHAFMCHFRS